MIGTVQGDLHDIGKNLVTMILKGQGFQVEDLGVSVSAAKFVEAVREKKPEILAMSALLTTTMTEMKNTIEALKAAGLRAAGEGDRGWSAGDAGVCRADRGRRHRL